MIPLRCRDGIRTVPSMWVRCTNGAGSRVRTCVARLTKTVPIRSDIPANMERLSRLKRATYTRRVPDTIG